jgi:hypothetical protein
VDFSNRKLGTGEGYQGCSERVLVWDSGEPSRSGLILDILFRSFWFYCSQNFKLFGFPIFLFLAFLFKVIPQTRRAH